MPQWFSKNWRYLQRAIFKAIFGLDLERVQALEKDMERLNKNIIITIKAIQEVEDMTGGDGWIDLTQLAMSALDSKTTYLEDVLKGHNEIISSILEHMTDPVNEEEDTCTSWENTDLTKN